MNLGLRFLWFLNDYPSYSAPFCPDIENSVWLSRPLLPATKKQIDRDLFSLLPF